MQSHHVSKQHAGLGTGTTKPDTKLPLHADWAGRPMPWRSSGDARLAEGIPSSHQLASDTAIFHDGSKESVSVTLIGNEGDGQVSVSLRAFTGTFLSLAIDLPEQGVARLTRQMIIQADVSVACTPAVPVFARINIRNGPNVEQITEEVVLGEEAVIEFDLFHSQLDASRVEAAWFDLIFNPSGNALIEIGDLVLSRRPRAQV